MALRKNQWVKFGVIVAIEVEPLGNLHNKAWCFVLVVYDLVRLRRPFIRQGHSLRPEVSPDG